MAVPLDRATRPTATSLARARRVPSPLESIVTLSQLLSRRQALVTKAIAATEDRTRPTITVKNELDRLELELKTVDNEIADARFIAAQRGNVGEFADLNTDPSGEMAALKGLIGPPSLRLHADGYKALFEAAGNHQTLSLKTVDESTVGPATIPDFRLPPVPFAREPLRVMDLMPVMATTNSVVDFYRTAGTTAASTVAEGAPKPESTIAFTVVPAPARKIAHVVEVTDEALNDFPTFLGLLQTDMAAGVIFEENHQILSGNGVAPDLTGILNTAGIQTRAKSTERSIETIELAATDLRKGSSYLEADGIVMSPTTWSLIRRTQDDQHRYLAGDPTQADGHQLWGVPVVITSAIADNTAIVANFQHSCLAWVRSGIQVQIAWQGSTQFKNNTTLVRCEERIAFGVTRPTGIVKVTGLT